MGVSSIPSRFLLAATLVLLCCSKFAAAGVRGALIVTIAGNHKLSEYFEWSCKTIGASKDRFDMLVFHESNSKLMSLNCASNVKLINLGENGLSKAIIAKVLDETTSNESVKGRMTMMLNDIITYGPRYLVEVKPMLGDLFREHLTEYSHWSYTDPDIIWGNLSDWIEEKDLERFEIVTFAKNNDAGRLFLRGQLAFHKNNDKMNSLWNGLGYFSSKSYPERLGSAFRMLQEKKSSDEIFNRNFVSAEGWYSQHVFKANITTKIAGRGFDDFYRHPVVLYQGRLSRCGLGGNLTGCIQEAMQLSEPVGVQSMPVMQLTPATAYYEATQCKMFWLPTETRYCIAEPVYAKKALLQKDSDAQKKLKLQRVGESVFEKGQWSINDEEAARRQQADHAAFFHFRHWDDFISKSISATWNPTGTTTDAADLGCMVLYLRADAAMAFEACKLVALKEKRGDQMLLTHTPYKGDSVSNTLTQQRKQSEVGPNHVSHPRPHHAQPPLGGAIDAAKGDAGADTGAQGKAGKLNKGLRFRGSKKNNNNQKKE
eukprot:gene22017-24962_t